MQGLKNVSTKVFVDLLCLFIIFLPWIVLQSVNTPYRRGFYCNDNTIKYPYLDNTVTNGVLTGCGFVIAFVAIIACECIIYFTDTKNRDAPLQLTSNLSVPHLVVTVYKYYGIFIFGLAAQQTIVNIGKYSIGRLRPHFLSVCQPDFSKINCTMAGQSNVFVYVNDYTCKEEEGKKAVDSRLSFPSGHSSFAAYCAVYLALYLHSRITWKMWRMLKHMLQALLIYGAFYVCLSRVSDFKHHPTDVLAGAIVGFFVAALVGLHVADFFHFKVILTRLGYYPPSEIFAGPSTSINMLGQSDTHHSGHQGILPLSSGSFITHDYDKRFHKSGPHKQSVAFDVAV